ncbi:MAG: hypothetical protein IKS90_02870 [Clostridia bacterium]|nr:hypothetical protein [Clostridia bacterium]
MAKNLFSIGRTIKKRNLMSAPGAPIAAEQMGGRASSSQPFAASAAGTQSKTGYSQPKPETVPKAAASGSTQQVGGFDDYYNRLVSTLRNYGVSMTLPSLDEIRAQLTAFLRPSVDSAIEDRKSRGETVMAELDADAYSRGMGGSSYLSSMKSREQSGISRDIASMESNYSSTIAQYLYNASNELQSIQAKFAQMALENAYEQRRLKQQQAHDEKMKLLALLGKGGSNAGRGASHGSTGGASNQAGGADGRGFTDKEYLDNYTGYSVFVGSLSESDRNNLFNGKSAYWAELREEMMMNLTPALYQKLISAYAPKTGGGKGPGAAPRSVNMFN